MAALVIPALWAILALALAGRGLRLCEAALVALLAVSAAGVVLSEALSLAGAISFWPVVAAWVVLAIGAVLWGRADLKAGAVKVVSSIRTLSKADLALSSLLAFFGAGTFASAVLYPITNYDSLTYHLPRVFFWLQHGSVAHYPTPEGRQLFSSTLVEYLVLQLRVLSGDFRLSNLVQWASYVFVVVVVSLLAKRLGADRRGQYIAALAAATVPMALLQASTTQNDLTCALWSLAALYWAIGYLREPHERVKSGQAVAAAVAVGLALEAKSTAYLLLAPFLVWILLALLRERRWRDIVRAVAVVLLAVLVIHGATFARDAVELDGDVLALNAPGNTHILVKDRSAEALATNAIKNTSLLLGSPSQSVNARMASAIVGVIRAYGGDPENPLTKEEADRAYEISNKITNHDIAPAPLTVLVVAASAIALALRRRKGSLVLPYVVCALVGLLITAGLIKWNPFINRVLLGDVLLWTPLVGVAATRVAEKNRHVAAILTSAALALLVLWGSAVMLLNTTNRLLPYPIAPIGNRDLGWWNSSYEELQYRVLVPQLEQPFQTIARSIRERGDREIGLYVRAKNFPIWPLLSALPDRRFSYVGETVLPERFSPRAIPPVVVEISPGQSVRAVLSDGTKRGPVLVPPTETDGIVILAYRHEEL